MDGRGDNTGWQGPPYRDEPRGGRDDRRGYGEPDPRYDYGDDLVLPAPRSGEPRQDPRADRYVSLAELNSRGESREFSRGPRSGEPMPPPPSSGAPYSSGPPPSSGAPYGSGPPPFEPAPAFEQQRSFESQRSFEPVPDRQQPLREKTGPIDAAAVRRSVAETDGLYRSKRPAFAALAGFIVAMGEALMLRPMLANAFDVGPGAVAGALAPFLAMIAFPLLGLGLYALTTGAATAVQFQGPRVWLRTPLIYLVLGVALLLAAGTAAA